MRDQKSVRRTRPVWHPDLWHPDQQQHLGRRTSYAWGRVWRGTQQDMRMPEALKRLDDKVLGDRLKGSPSGGSAAPADPYPGDEEKTAGGATRPEGKAPAPEAKGKPEGKPEGKSEGKPAAKAESKPVAEKRTKTTTTSRPADAKSGGSAAGKAASKGVDLIVKIVRGVLLALALIVVAGIVMALVPTNPENSVVQFVNETASTVAGPFKDVFALSSPKKSISANYGLAAVVYLVLASLVGKLRSVVS